MEPGLGGEGGGLDDDSVRPSCGSSVDGARSSSVQTHAADAPREWLRERNPGAENWGKRRRRRCEGDSRDCLNQHRHAAVPRNPSSKRGTASPSPWL